METGGKTPANRGMTINLTGQGCWGAKRFINLIVLLSLLGGGIWPAECAQAQTLGNVTLAWDASTGTNIIGYRLYWGNASRTYNHVINAGNVTQATAAGIIAGVPCYFAATVYTSDGLESDFSDEVSHTVPSTNSPPVLVLTAPVSGAGYAAPATISLAASVIPNGHSITKVQFYSGSALLTEDTTAPYLFTWRRLSVGSYTLSAVAVYDAGNSVASTRATVTVTNPATPYSVTFASTSGTISGPLYVTNGAIAQPAYTTLTTGGQAVYGFITSAAGSYVVTALVNAPGLNNNSFYVNIDAQPTEPTMIWDIPVTQGFANRTVSWRGNGGTDASSPSGLDAQYAPAIFNLTAGTHQLIVRGREGNAQLGTITITPYGGTLGSNPPPGSVSGTNPTVPYGGATPLTNPAPVTSLTFASTSAVISAPYVISGSTIAQPAYTSLEASGQALYTFAVPATGNYVVTALVDAPSTDNNSLWFNIDAQPTDPLMVWDISVASGVVSQTASWRGNGIASSSNASGLTAQYVPKVFTLIAGTHCLILRGREGNCQVGTITIVPTSLPAN